MITIGIRKGLGGEARKPTESVNHGTVVIVTHTTVVDVVVVVNTVIGKTAGIAPPVRLSQNEFQIGPSFLFGGRVGMATVVAIVVVFAIVVMVGASVVIVAVVAVIIPKLLLRYRRR